MTKQQKIGVILAQVGTPEAPTKQALKPYLRAFLSDERIIDSPRWQWLPILHGIVLQRRPAKIAKHFEEIWTDKGSPLLIISQAQVKGVQKRLGSRYVVKLGFAYAEPGMNTAMQELHDAGVHRIIVVPMFPQYSTTTTASVYDEIMFHALGRSKRRGKPIKKYSPALRFVDPFYKDPKYIDVLADNIARQMKSLPHKPDKVLISYHGIPKSYVDEGDPCPSHCDETTRLLTKRLGWKTSFFKQTYQSRFGRAEWLQPYTQVELPDLYRQKVNRPLIIAPGFTTDCLETIHELGIEGAELYAEGGGKEENLMTIKCLNDEPKFLDYLAQKVSSHAGGW
jgi:protoporphyrin/coproporphyrin ferrochelatase